MAKARIKDAESALSELVASTVYDPHLFVEVIYPWKEQGTDLAEEDGPDRWQKEVLRALGESLRASEGDPVRMATASGHGIGKSALVAWLIHWFLSTRPHPQVVVTANTANQLLKKTFRELAVWHKRALNRHWFTWTATKFYHNENPDTWFASAIPWSKENADAFAGTHAKHVLMVFDEASSIHDRIWDVTEGALTTNTAVWVAFGNPTRNTGKFRECFGKFSHRWKTFKVDSRTAKMTNKRLLDEWVQDYGEDSDFVRVRVRGEFPRSGTTQFIDSETVERAAKNAVKEDPNGVKTLAVDVARFGDDKSVISRRVGARMLPMMKLRGLDTMQLAARVAMEIDDFQPDATMVDGTGLGAGVVDRLRQLNYRVVDVLPGSKPDDPNKYFNKRAEMWGRLKDWLRGDVQIPDDEELKASLTGIEYGMSDRTMAIQLERKQDMKARGMDSPDEGDAAAYHFAEPVRQKTSMLILPEGYRDTGVHRRRAALDWRVM